MIEKKVTVQGDSGIHARPASMLVKTATKFASEVYVIRDETEANLKSIMNVLAMGITGGTEVAIRADGDDEAEAVDAIVNLFESNFK